MKTFAIKVHNKRESKFVQKLAFKNGYTTYDGTVLDFSGMHYSIYLNFNYQSDNGVHWDDLDTTIKYDEYYDFRTDLEKIYKLFEPEFKVGDFVKCVKSETEGEDNWVKDDKIKIGYILEIERITHDGRLIFPEKVYNHNPEFFIQATSEEIEESKKKDKIFVGEHEVEFVCRGIKIGCEEFPNSFATVLHKLQQHKEFPEFLEKLPQIIERIQS